MVGLTLLIGILNLYLGYQVAVWLGYGPPGIRQGWQALGLPLRTERPAGSAEEPFPAGAAEAPASASIEEMLDDGSERSQELSAKLPSEPYGGDVAELPHPETPDNWDANEYVDQRA